MTNKKLWLLILVVALLVVGFVPPMQGVQRFVTILTQNITVSNTATFSGPANFDGATDFDSTVDFSGATVTGVSTSTLSTLTVTGATALNGGLTMDSTAFRVADTSGNTDINGTLTVTGTSDFNAAMNVDANVDADSFSTAGNSDLTTINNSTGDITINDNVDITGTLQLPVNVEHIGALSVLTSTVAYTPATGALWTITDGEIWLVHSLFIQTTTNFDCTGNDCTLKIGDGNVAAGFIDANDAALQAAFTEATGYAAGFYGIEAGSGGVYTLDDGGPFVYAPSGADETIDYVVGGTDPAAGAGTVWIIYTRIR